MADTTYYAHGNRPDRADPVREHLRLVAKRASEYASAFDASDEAYLAGLLHDLGKYGELFQKRLRGEAVGIDHWSSGAWETILLEKISCEL